MDCLSWNRTAYSRLKQKNALYIKRVEIEREKEIKAYKPEYVHLTLRCPLFILYTYKILYRLANRNSEWEFENDKMIVISSNSAMPSRTLPEAVEQNVII